MELLLRLLALFSSIALFGCATAVNDSLDRRGVDPAALLIKRIEEARNDAFQAKTAFSDAALQLAKTEGLNGAALAQQLDFARGAGQQSILATQELGLSMSSVDAAAIRYFDRRKTELDLMGASDQSRISAEHSLKTTEENHRVFLATYGNARTYLSSALSDYSSEVDTLRKNATSGIAADARSEERAAAINAASMASDNLTDVINSANDYLASIN